MIFGIGPVVRGDNQRGEPPERRQSTAFALLNFTGVECVCVAADDCPHHRMIRLVGLDQSEALATGSTGASRHLIEKLEGAFSCAGIAIGKPQIGIHDTHQCHVGKVMPLGNKLRADHDIRLAFCDSIEFQPQPLHAACHIRRKNYDSRFAERCRDFFRDALHARTAGDQMIQGAAFGTSLRHRLMIAALMTHQLPAKTMFHEPA